MKAYIVPESYKASTQLITEHPKELEYIQAYRNSAAACQILLHDGLKNHFIFGREFSIPDEIEIPMYRLEVKSDLPVKLQFEDYYIGNENIEFADKLIDQTAKTYSGDRFAPIYMEVPINPETKIGTYPIEITLYRSELTGKDEKVLTKSLNINVGDYCFPKDMTQKFNLDIWQQPSNIARTFQVPLWSEEHFRLLDELAKSLAALGQKAITIIAGEIPWKGWFNYIVKDYPANLYEYSMIKVKKNKSGQIECDFSILDRYIDIMFKAGICKEINIFGLLGVWHPPFFPLVKDLDHPEKLVIRYYDEVSETIDFVQDRLDLQHFLKTIFAHFKALGIWDKVRIISDEPKVHEIPIFKQALAILKSIDPTLKVKVAFDKEEVLKKLIEDVDYPVTSYYCTCNNYRELQQSHPGKTQYYICNYPDKPNTFLHSPLLETRLQGVLAHYFKTDGLLRWAYNCWPENAIQDIRYNTSSLPIGDLCMVYPSHSGHILLSLRYKELQRGIEDFHLIKEAEQINPEAVLPIIENFLEVKNPEEWMLNSHLSNPNVFRHNYSSYDKLREELLNIINLSRNDR
ncbi:DUF4091 domain-containing protein [Lactococcus lactis]|uniref:DUF4091 domain-containing protein n=1 Tax=Lactococcus lactis TaxID=1358 RepID=UPI002415A117|nr:DUF4091 domain-containing protein [Lactococcus lactis]MDG4957512.1 DUF4091 domain-containing protein [Lactococcus lactis]